MQDAWRAVRGPRRGAQPAVGRDRMLDLTHETQLELYSLVLRCGPYDRSEYMSDYGVRRHQNAEPEYYVALFIGPL